MSKTQFKKELASLDRGQLVTLLLDLYSARKEAKEYFDFFCNPDQDKLFDKYIAVVDKELSRGKYRECKARISRIKGAVREFASYGVEPEAVLKMYCRCLALGLLTEQRLNFPPTLIRGFAGMLDDMVKFADRHNLYGDAMAALAVVLNGDVGYRGFVNFLRRQLGIDPLPA